MFVFFVLFYFTPNQATIKTYDKNPSLPTDRGLVKVIFLVDLGIWYQNNMRFIFVSHPREGLLVRSYFLADQDISSQNKKKVLCTKPTTPSPYSEV